MSPAVGTRWYPGSLAISICPALPAASTANENVAGGHAPGLYAVMARGSNPVDVSLSSSSTCVAMVNRARQRRLLYLFLKAQLAISYTPIYLGVGTDGQRGGRLSGCGFL
jgi:hypothetical protein